MVETQRLKMARDHIGVLMKVLLGGIQVVLTRAHMVVSKTWGGGVVPILGSLNEGSYSLGSIFGALDSGKLPCW